MSRSACQHGTPFIYDCPDCGSEMAAEEYLAATYDQSPSPSAEDWELARINPVPILNEGDQFALLNALGVF
ncbi:hypothetical protein [Deinococcus phoenicis]|nr:hypothetical protein [Deinococcus phoenicis]